MIFTSEFRLKVSTTKQKSHLGQSKIDSSRFTFFKNRHFLKSSKKQWISIWKTWNGFMNGNEQKNGDLAQLAEHWFEWIETN